MLLVLTIILFACGTCFIISLAFRGSYRGEGVALIYVDGTLTASSEGGMTGWGTSAESLVEQLHRARKEDRIKAVLLRVDSPGGTPAAAEEVFTEVRRTARKKPVVVSVGDMCASAAYQIASASDCIYASPDSDVGSIGVIAQLINLEGLNQKIGVRYFIFTKGQHKDMYSPFRVPTPEETAILQGQMQVAYDNFIANVARGRQGRMTEEKVRELANGLTWPGVEAKGLGLIDELGNFRDAAEKAGKLGGIKGEVHLIRMNQSSPLSLFGDFIEALRELVRSTGLYNRDAQGIKENPTVR